MHLNQAFFKKLVDRVENPPKTIRPIPDYVTSAALSKEFNCVLNRCSLLRRYTNTCLPNPVLLTRDAERLQQEMDRFLALEAKRFEVEFLHSEKQTLRASIENIDCLALAFSEYANFILSWDDFLKLVDQPSFCEHRLLDAVTKYELLYNGELGSLASCNLVVDTTKQISRSYFFTMHSKLSVLYSQPVQFNIG